MNRYPTATLWLFGYDGISPATHLCVVREALAWPNLGHAVMADDALISRSRSRVASTFLRSERNEAGDILLMVDHDIQWQPGDLPTIARHALERTAVVAGIYPKRAFGQGAAIRLAASGTFRLGSDEIIPARYVSAGFLAIPRDVLQSLATTLPLIIYEDGNFWPFFLPMVVETDRGQEYLSEDWAFCERVGSGGYRVLAACAPRLTHEGNYCFRAIDGRARPPRDEPVTLNLSPSTAGIPAGG